MSSRPRTRATIAVVAWLLLSTVVVLILFPALFPASATLLARDGLPARDPQTQKMLAAHVDTIRNITAAMLPTVLASAYWLAVLRFRRTHALEVSLEAIGLCILLLTAVAAGLITLASLLVLDQAMGYPGPLWWLDTLGSIPDLLVRSLELAAGCGLSGTLSGALFARWPPLRERLGTAAGSDLVAVVGALGGATLILVIQIVCGLLLLAPVFVPLARVHPGDAIFLGIAWLIGPALAVVAHASRTSLRRVVTVTFATSGTTQPVRLLSSPPMRRGAGIASLGGALATLGYLLPWCFLSVVFLVSSCNQQPHLETQQVAPTAADLALQSGAALLLGLVLLLAALMVLGIGLSALQRQHTRRWLGAALGAAGIGAAIVSSQSYLLLTGTFPLAKAQHITFLGFGPGFWLMLAGFVLGVVGASVMVYVGARDREGAFVR